jgi:dCTP diphosphatase
MRVLGRRSPQSSGWAQFHSPKNLVMALSAEIGELTEIVQWLTEEESRAIRESPADLALVREELADIVNYLILLADLLAVDLGQAAWDKIAVNEGSIPLIGLVETR